MAMTKEDRLKIVHERAMKRFNSIIDVAMPERLQCLADRRFYSIPGAMTEGDLFTGKLKLESNKLHGAVMKVVTDLRTSRTTVNFVSKDGSGDNDLAEVCNGLFRAMEQESTSEEAYDNAKEEAAGGGFGALRLRAVYEDEEDEDSDDQVIRLEPIVDADSCVFFDLAAERQDKADAKFCFVLTAMTPDDFKEAWGEPPTGVDKPVSLSQFDWYGKDVIYIAEYYEVEEKKETVRVFADLLENETKYYQDEIDDELEAELLAKGHTEVRSKSVKRKKVRKYLLSGSKTLSDEGYIAGKCIPIIPVYGKRWYVDGVERCMGVVRLAKDMQRLKNLQLSKLGEISALSPIEKPILTPEQVAGHEYRWADDNLVNRPYLLINSLTDANGTPIPAGPIAYTKPPQIPPALGALLQVTEQDIRDILGQAEAQEQVVSNVSGKAVELMQTRIDSKSYIYQSNWARSVKRIGEVFLSMAQELYTREGRKMKSVDIQGGINSVEIGKPYRGKDGLAKVQADLTKASFDVAVDVGPSSASRKEATVRALTGMLQITQDPETAQVLQSMAMLNMEGEGIAEVRDYFRKKLVSMGVIAPSDEEKAEMAKASEPSQNELALQAMADQAQAEASKARASVVKIVAETEKVQADTEKVRAETVDILADLDMRTGGLPGQN